MTHYINYYTPESSELNTQILPKLNGRHQLDYDYNGALDNDVDTADCYRAVKAVRVG